jgi:hypothetical protein
MDGNYNASDVIDFFYRLPKSLQHQLLHQVRQMFWPAIQTSQNFCDVLKNLNTQSKAVLFSCVQDDLPNAIRSVEDFVLIAMYLRSEQITQVWDKCSLLTPKTPRELGQLIKVLPSSYLEALVASYHPEAVNGLEIGLMLRMLSKSQIEKVYSWLDQLLNVIQIDHSDDFDAIMPFLNKAQRKQVFEKNWLALPEMIHNSLDFNKIFKYLDYAQIHLLFYSVDLSHVCHTCQDMILILSSLPFAHVKRFYFHLPQTEESWGLILGELPKEKAELLTYYFPRSLSNGQCFANMQMFLDKPKQQQLFELFFHKFVIMIKTEDDLKHCCRYLDNEQKKIILMKCAYHIFQWPYARQILQEVYPELTTFILHFPKYHSFVIALLSHQSDKIEQEFKCLLLQIFEHGNDNQDISLLSEQLVVLHPNWTHVLNQSLHLGMSLNEEHTQDVFRLVIHQKIEDLIYLKHSIKP